MNRRKIASTVADAAESEHDWFTSCALPPLPTFIRFYDKVSHTECVIETAKNTWPALTDGRVLRYTFVPGVEGLLQKTLLVLGRNGEGSGSTLRSSASAIVKQWPALKAMLQSHPLEAKRNWSRLGLNRQDAAAFRGALRVACRLSLGEWSPNFLRFIEGLKSTSEATRPSKGDRIASRSHGASLDEQAHVVRCLDASATDLTLDSAHLNGLVALAFAFQHGMRPVQFMSLQLSHVRFVEDISGQPACIVSFHAAKQRGAAPELARQVRPEWVSLVSRLFEDAVALQPTAPSGT